jgi:hypothetical protein
MRSSRTFIDFLLNNFVKYYKVYVHVCDINKYFTGY